MERAKKNWEDNMENSLERRQEKGTGGDLRQRDRGDRKRVPEGA